MIDAVSVAGFSIAIFDQILKLGERTGQLIKDIKEFDEDARRLHNDMTAENHRNAYLKHLLFTSSPVYGSKTLFEQFPDDIQDEIRFDLDEIESVIAESVKLLEKHYTAWSKEKAKEAVSGLSGRSSASISSSSLNLYSSRESFIATSKSHLQLFRWSLKGKRRVQEVIGHFAKLNSRIHEKIKLCSFSSAIGVDLRHLERLQTDPVSIELGFHLDASLKLMAENAQQLCVNLELSKEESIDQVRNLSMVEKRFAIGKWTGTSVPSSEEQNILVEYRDYEPDFCAPNNIDDRMKGRVESLAKLLQQPKEQVFRIPCCLWWSYVPASKQILLAFKIPGDLGQQPTSQFSLLHQDLKMSLNNKVKLALGLSKCLAQLQMVKWVHESIRSENILFWPSRHIGTRPEDLGARLDFSQPWVLGFDKSRPETGFSCALTDVCWERDIYRHPDRQGRPEKSFHKLHDIYALGVVLLEIGVWEPAQEIARRGRIGIIDSDGGKRSYDISETQTYFQKQARRRLESYMGRKYMQVVLTCLSGEFGVQDDTREELRLQQAYRTQVVDALEQMANNI